MKLKLVLLLLAIIAGGCSKGNEPELSKVTDILQDQLANIKQIQVQYADGNKLGIANEETINQIVSELKKLELEYVSLSPQGAGYLYVLTLINDSNKEVAYSNSLYLNGSQYKSTDNRNTELDKWIVSEGRKENPHILSGYE